MLNQIRSPSGIHPRVTLSETWYKEMDILIRANDMLLGNDYASFKAYLTDLMRAGACKILDQGERVLVEKKEGPALCLRLVRGQPCFWAAVLP